MRVPLLNSTDNYLYVSKFQAPSIVVIAHFIVCVNDLHMNTYEYK